MNRVAIAFERCRALLANGSAAEKQRLGVSNQEYPAFSQRVVAMIVSDGISLDVAESFLKKPPLKERLRLVFRWDLPDRYLSQVRRRIRETQIPMAGR